MGSVLDGNGALEQILFFSPMGLKKDPIDMNQIDNFGSVVSGFHKGRNAKVAAPTKHTIAGAYHEVKSFFRKRAMRQTTGVQLAQNEVFYLVGIKALKDDGVGEPTLNFFVNGKIEGAQQRGKPDEDKIVVFWEFFKQKP